MKCTHIFNIINLLGVLLTTRGRGRSFYSRHNSATTMGDVFFDISIGGRSMGKMIFHLYDDVS